MSQTAEASSVGCLVQLCCVDWALQSFAEGTWAKSVWVANDLQVDLPPLNLARAPVRLRKDSTQW